MTYLRVLFLIPLIYSYSWLHATLKFRMNNGLQSYSKTLSFWRHIP